MWLINTETLELNYFSNDDEVIYAILSHRWEEEEVSMQDLRQGCILWKKGFAKIKQSCAIALQTNIQYMWIDTCCIDKTSSAELSEAINSMYKWYKQAKICYAYLSDVETISDLAGSKWFTRGWTLQELIAPETVKFFNRNWKSFGSKAGLQGRVASITGIPTRVLRGASPTEYSVAQRMFWAAHRVTTRPEDIAYCLMGLFEVNMPMLYGEGTRAFTRLQEEIIKTLDDQSIFAWIGSASGHFPVLASSPADFKHGAGIRSTSATSEPTPFSMTNVGLNIELPIMPFAMNTYLAVLQCHDMTIDREMMPHARSKPGTTRIGILIRRTPQDRQYIRYISTEATVHQIDASDYASHLRTVPVLLLQRMRKLGELNNMYGFYFRTMTSKVFGHQKHSYCDLRPPRETHHVLCKLPEDRVRRLEIMFPDRIARINDKIQILRHVEQLDLDLRFGEHGTVATFTLRDTDVKTPNSTIAFAKFGFDFDFNPVVIFYSVSSGEWGSYTKSHELYWADDRDLDEELATYAKMDQGHCWKTHGIFALRGSKTSGLDMRLEQLGIHLVIAEEFQHGAKKWIVDVSARDLPFEHCQTPAPNTLQCAIRDLYNAELVRQRMEAQLQEAITYPKRTSTGQTPRPHIESLSQGLEEAKEYTSFFQSRLQHWVFNQGLCNAWIGKDWEAMKIIYAKIAKVAGEVTEERRAKEAEGEEHMKMKKGRWWFPKYEALNTEYEEKAIIAVLTSEADQVIRRA